MPIANSHYCFCGKKIREVRVWVNFLYHSFVIKQLGTGSGSGMAVAEQNKWTIMSDSDFFKIQAKTKNIFWVIKEICYDFNFKLSGQMTTFIM